MLDLAEFSNDPALGRDVLLHRLEGETDADGRAAIHYRLWEICQFCGDEAAALRHLDAGMVLDPVQRPAAGPENVGCPRVVVLNVRGTFQSNAPVELLLGAAVELYTLWVGGQPDQRDRLVRAVRSVGPDAVILAMGEDVRQNTAILEAGRIAELSDAPVINDASRIMRLSRSRVPGILAGLAGVVTPWCLAVGGPAVPASVAQVPDVALLVRPVSSHAGHGLEKVSGREELRDYMQRVPEVDGYYVTRFVDYAGGDGLYRKYRVVFVDGEVYPVHLAIHDHWAIWYYNAAMERFPERRAEEARFMLDMADYFPFSVIGALHGIARRIGLDYFGLDFGVQADGTLVVFEVETGMIVHDRDDPEIFPYKSPAIAKARHAFEALIRRRSQEGKSAVAREAMGAAVHDPVGLG